MGHRKRRDRGLSFARALPALLAAPLLFAQGPDLSCLTDPGTELSFAECHLYFDGGSRHKIPFLPVVNPKRAPCGTERYTTDVRLKAPIVFLGDGVVRKDGPDPYRGQFVMFSYDFPDRVNGAREREVPLDERIRGAVARKAAVVVLFSAREENPFPAYRQEDVVPEIPVIAIKKRDAALILRSDYRNPDRVFALWEWEGKFEPGALISKLTCGSTAGSTKSTAATSTSFFSPAALRATRRPSLRR